MKPEPATPADTTEHVHSTVESTASSIHRRGQAGNASKRKRSLRGTSEASDASTSGAHPSPAFRKDMLVAVRNFPRLSHSVMDSIQSHKHASLFAAPVREKDAQGYHEYIKQPQNLKSIRAAIQSGARAVAAATSDLTPGGPASARDASTVLLPLSEELVPPKGIVNSAQLEKEIMRMFANAVMFNPGEDELVQDAREMAESAAVTLATFRNAERTSGGNGNGNGNGASEADELVDGVADDSSSLAGPPPAKRKRVN